MVIINYNLILKKNHIINLKKFIIWLFLYYSKFKFLSNIYEVDANNIIINTKENIVDVIFIRVITGSVKLYVANESIKL